MDGYIWLAMVALGKRHMHDIISEQLLGLIIWCAWGGGGVCVSRTRLVKAKIVSFVTKHVCILILLVKKKECCIMN